MEEAYVCVNAVPGQERKAMLAILEVAGVEKAEGVYGVYDLIVRICAPDLKAIESAVHRIRSNHSVMGTFTMNVI